MLCVVCDCEHLKSNFPVINACLSCLPCQLVSGRYSSSSGTRAQHAERLRGSLPHRRLGTIDAVALCSNGSLDIDWAGSGAEIVISSPQSSDQDTDLATINTWSAQRISQYNLGIFGCWV